MGSTPYFSGIIKTKLGLPQKSTNSLRLSSNSKRKKGQDQKLGTKQEKVLLLKTKLYPTPRSLNAPRKCIDWDPLLEGSVKI